MFVVKDTIDELKKINFQAKPIYCNYDPPPESSRNLVPQPLQGCLYGLAFIAISIVRGRLLLLLLDAGCIGTL